MDHFQTLLQPAPVIAGYQFKNNLFPGPSIPQGIAASRRGIKIAISKSVNKIEP
jgi:hypothetical protein